MKLSPHIDYLHSPNKSYGHVRQILYHQGVQGKGAATTPVPAYFFLHVQVYEYKGFLARFIWSCCCCRT